MYLTAQRVVSRDGQNGINGFLYKHGDVSWGSSPPELVSGAVGELVHMLVTVRPGGNKVMSYVDILAPDDARYGQVRGQISSWVVEQASARRPLPWSGVVGDMRLGVHMVSRYAQIWESEVAKLLAACQMTLDQSSGRAAGDLSVDV